MNDEEVYNLKVISNYWMRTAGELEGELAAAIDRRDFFERKEKEKADTIILQMREIDRLRNALLQMKESPSCPPMWKQVADLALGKP